MNVLLSAGCVALLAIASAHAAAPALPVTDPLAPAQAGMVQCYDPDRANLSCRSIAAFSRDSGGGWISQVTILPDPAQSLTLDIASPVTVRDGAVCGAIRRAQVLAGKLRYFDKPLPADRALPLLVQIADALGGDTGREICTVYVPLAGGFIAHSRISGSAAEMPGQRMVWVRRDAGYHVAPRGKS
jgi:hypothetical protein